MNTKSTWKIRDANGALYTMNLTYKAVKPGHKRIASKKMKLMAEDFNELKKKYGEEIITISKSSNPYNRLAKIIKTSATGGSMGFSTRHSDNIKLTKAEIKQKREEASRYISENITAEALQKKLEVDQEGLCYWRGIKIDPMRVFTYRGPKNNKGEYSPEPYWGDECEAMSADRVKMVGSKYETGYRLDNIVITTRGINKMRNDMEHDKFILALNRQGISINPKLKPLLEKLLKNENKES
jgi:hypothetical protein